MCDEVLNANLGMVVETARGDQNVDLADQIVRGFNEPVDRCAVRKIEVGGEGRRTPAAQLDREPLANLDVAATHQHQIAAPRQSCGRCETRRRRRVGDDDGAKLDHELLVVAKIWGSQAVDGGTRTA